MCPSLKQLTGNEQPLPGPFSQWSSEWWSSGREWGKRQILAFSVGLPTYLASGWWVSWGGGGWQGTGNRLHGCVLHGSRLLAKAPQPLSWWICFPFPSLRLNGSGSLRGSQSFWPGLCRLGGWGAWGSVGSRAPGSLSNNSWAKSGNMALGSYQLRSASSQPGRDVDLGGWKLCLGTLPVLVRTGNNIYLVVREHYYLTMTWP